MMSTIDTDALGYVRGFPYHDGWLTGVLLDEDGEARAHLALRSADGQRRVVTLSGLIALSLEGVREGNIVLSLRCCTKALLSRCPEVASVAEQRLGLTSAQLPEGCLVFVLESSYGADLVAACSEALVSDRGVGMTIVREPDAAGAGAR